MLPEHCQVQRVPLAHPGCPLRVVPLVVPFERVRVDQRRQRPAVDHQPRDERAELLRREDVDLEHPDRMRADGAVEELVDP